MDWMDWIGKMLCFGCAAFGFSVLFNVPPRTLPMIWVMGAICGALKLVFTDLLVWGVIVGSFAGATLAGGLSVWAAHYKHAPPMVFAIPSVIPMVPGTFAYRMMMGIIKLAGSVNITTDYSALLHQTIHYGLKTLFVLMALAVGVSIPMLVTRRDSVKRLGVSKGS